jgi:hypothetical protein
MKDFAKLPRSAMKTTQVRDGLLEYASLYSWVPGTAGDSLPSCRLYDEGWLEANGPSRVSGVIRLAIFTASHTPGERANRFAQRCS